MRTDALHLGRVEVTSGFLLAAAALLYLDQSGILPWALAACACHELGHWAVIRLTGGRIAVLRLSAVGAELRLSALSRQSRAGRCLSALAGPGTNLFLALLCSRLGDGGWHTFTGMNLTLGCFNLLPVGQLDGGQALACLLGDRWYAVSEVISLATAAVLTLAGVVAFWLTRSNFTLLLTAAWLLFMILREKRENF